MKDAEDDSQSVKSQEIELAWARVAGYPWWPAGVRIDESN
jgi:hypothetical protein